MATLIVSDLHLGNGQGYDIFAGAAALPALLLRFARPGDCVIINGDSVDFLMNEDPLELTEARALAQAAQCFSAPSTAIVFSTLGQVLAAGGEVVVRLGNHDIELALGAVQQRLREALGQPAAVAARLRFERGDQPAILTVGGVRVVVTHGEHCDPWNRVDYANLPGPEIPQLPQRKKFSYGPGSRLAKTLMNPLKRAYGLRFADLMKPDFQGGVMTALAVNPRAVKSIFQGSTLTLLWQLFRQLSGPSSFAAEEGPPEPELGLAAIVDRAELSLAERAALTDLLDPDADSAVSFGEESDTGTDAVLDTARGKLGLAGLHLYARAQRTLTADSGSRYFALPPDAGEWTEAERLAHKYNARAVIFGHTHAARWQASAELVFINTGTWIWLMKLPCADAPPEEWTRFLELARRNPRLDPKLGPSVPLFTRFTAAIVETHPAGGARLSLVEWKDDELYTLGEQHVLP
jgi:predicted phosphodiesterase